MERPLSRQLVKNSIESLIQPVEVTSTSNTTSTATSSTSGSTATEEGSSSESAGAIVATCEDEDGKPCLQVRPIHITHLSIEIASFKLTFICVFVRTCRFQIIQATPLRVLHRRSLLHRSRYIYSLRAIVLSKHFLLLTLVTSAGAYVKEFVHGELGRTNPSLASILQCRVSSCIIYYCTA